MRLCDDCSVPVDRPPRSPVALCAACAHRRLSLDPLSPWSQERSIQDIRTALGKCPHCGADAPCGYADGDCVEP